MKLYNPLYTVADIFRSHFDEYNRQYGPLPKHYYAAANAIMQCRTEQLGGHIYQCDSCSHEVTLYNSCRNRHCPQCQAMARAHWVDQRMKDALPVPYFHVVFTIPHQLNGIVLRNKKPFYSLMFKAVSETLLTLAHDPKRLGGQIGFIAALHTWGQNLMDHPHIHCIVPGGAFHIKDNAWKQCKNNFLFPIAVLQKMFRGKCMDYFRKAIADGTINPMFSATSEFPDFEALLQKLYTIKWVVYVKEPFTSVQNLVKYLARYTHRVAISNHRILNFENGFVTFAYKDYKDHDKKKSMTLSAIEFIRRFMLHILPQGFMRIRQYGFLANKVKKKQLPLIRESMVKTECRKHETSTEATPVTYYNPFLCPHCNKGTLIKLMEVAPAENVSAKAVNG